MKPDTHRPCVACQISPKLDRLITEQAERSGISRAALVRGVLERAFAAPSPGRAWELDADHERETRT